MSCTEKCWTPVECSHGYRMWPAGRSKPMDAYSHECEEENSRKNTMHLFSEHDSTRWYHDKEGWKAHEDTCLECNQALEEDES